MPRIGFIGCHEVSFHCLKKISNLSLQYGDTIEIVFDLLPEKAAKHSASISLNPLQKEFQFPLFHINSVTDLENVQLLQQAKLDILFIVGWHRIVPQLILDQAKLCLGLHASLLPKDRGSSPINWQLIRGDSKGGVTLFHLSTGVDSGPIVASKEYNISPNDNVRTVYYKTIINCLKLLEENWNDIHNLNPKKIQQDDSKATINERRRPSDGLIDWSKNSLSCYNWIRALTNPYPGAFTYWKGKKILIWESKISQYKETKIGEILEADEKIIVSTGIGSLELLILQVEDEPICSGELFCKSYGLQKGDILK